MPEPKNRILILGMTAFSQKNRYQIEQLNKHGYIYDIEVLDRRSTALDVFAGLENYGNVIQIAQPGLKGIYRRFINAIKKLKMSDVHHLEIYPGGRFAFIYAILSKVMRQKILVVERGDLVNWHVHNRFTKLSMWLCYKLSDYVWYREPYMRAYLKRFNIKKYRFIHNAAPYKSGVTRAKKHDIDFLWVNRLIEQRRADWFLKALQLPQLSNSKNVLLGIEQNCPDQFILDNQNKLKDMVCNADLKEFIDPLPYYARARFFVLPATIVFCNFALLEAMQSGVIPIVSEAEGTELIVEDGVNGFIVSHNCEAFKEVMMHAFELSPEKEKEMSMNAKKTIEEKFNQGVWSKKLLTLYRDLESDIYH